MTSENKPIDAVQFHSSIAESFHGSYSTDSRRMERVPVWRSYLARFGTDVKLGYDIGCGTGVLTCELAAIADRVIAVDGAEGMLTVAKKTVAERGFENVTFFQRRVPFDTTDFERADVIICSSVIEYLDSLQEALRWFHDFLKPGGTFIFSMPNRDSVSRKLVRTVHKLTGKPQYIGFIRHIVTEEGISASVRQEGLELLTYSYYGCTTMIDKAVAVGRSERYSHELIIVAARRPA